MNNFFDKGFFSNGNSCSTHNNKSSFGPLAAVTLGPIESLLLFHGDLNIGLLSDSLLLMLSLEMGVAGTVGLSQTKSLFVNK